MALTKQQKAAVVDEVASLLASSKMTVVAKYQGTTVKALQQLRREAKDNGTRVRVVKNRLVIQAIKNQESLNNIDTSGLNGMLLYAFNGEDEVAPAQVLAKFAKQNPTLEFVGAINPNGSFLAADEVKALAALPSKNQLIAQVLATLVAPLSESVNALAGDMHGLLDGLAAKAG